MSDQWRVVAFDRDKLVGILERAGKRLRFHSTSFQSDTSFRWPRVSELVDVAFNKSGELLSVHGK